MRAALSAYRYRIDNLIERYQAATDFYFFRNRGRALIRGVELELHADVGARVTLDSTAMLTRGTAVDDGAPLDDIPPATFTLAARRPVGTRGFVQVRGAFYGRDDRPGPTEIRMPGYTLVDLVGGATLGKALDVNVAVRNLLDRTYPVSPDARAVPAPGLNAVLTVVAKF
jgi:outer membrane receptor protein involved in Fe transport